MKVKYISNKWTANLLAAAVSGLLLVACSSSKNVLENQLINSESGFSIAHDITGSLTKKLTLDVINPKNYANISVYANDELIVDNLDVPTTGQQELQVLVRFKSLGQVNLKLVSNHASLTLNSLLIEDAGQIQLPEYRDITVKAGMDKAESIKYGGPTIADMDNDGDYDFIVNNHNAESSKLYWNNGDGTVSKHHKNLSRWFKHDLHGTAAGDYDNDGDLDLIVTQGGGNGKNPSRANFLQNNNGQFVLTTGDVGIVKGSRGRGAQWSDMDLDGDLDLMLINEESLDHERPIHHFYENLGTGKFARKMIDGVQDQHPSRSLLTDINGDNIDDLILYSPLSVWQGNGDFTFTEVTAKFPEAVTSLKSIMAITDIDIDNDGDLDLYLATSEEFEFGTIEAPSIDYEPSTETFSIKPKGTKGTDEFEFIANNDFNFTNYSYLARGGFNGNNYPIFLGESKKQLLPKFKGSVGISADQAQGWPDDISQNGIYFGHTANGNWKTAVVRNGSIFWNFKFSLVGVKSVVTKFEPKNRNSTEFLLRNDGDKFTDVSKQWNIPTATNAFGVTTGDFNNDSYQDLFVYRWGKVGAMISDYMLLNTGNGSFVTTTMHGANDVGGPGNGDMGQAFDFDLDGDLELLNGSEGGEWYLYENNSSEQGHYALVKVGYSPVSNVDALSAEVILTTAKHKYRKRVGSAGSVFSQSLLNIVHFGLGELDEIKSIQVKWRNGETAVFKNKKANQIFDTNKLDPASVAITTGQLNLRKGTSTTLATQVKPVNAAQEFDWISSDESVLSVDQQGVVTAIGEVGQTANITAISQANGKQATSQVTIVDWYAQTVESISLLASGNHTQLISGDSLALQVSVLPNNADDKSVTWSSSDTRVAEVNSKGEVKALTAGTVTITASSNVNSSIKAELTLTVLPLIKPSLTITNAAFIEENLRVGEELNIAVDYHAGSGNQVISSDQGGIRYWLRHFRSKWSPIKDTVLIDTNALKTESGQSSMSISLDGLTPTDELPAGQFYQLRVSFTNSKGMVQDALIYPLDIKKAD
ncbi:FG-GAP-like repeat-containing protein [Paraglaciecola sp. L3A3]|uniref:FG-GAP-like repeat-containing protein n=1 Tax=Paraglaciecola sp. L3A3 TaxID=2686358 RepID=UPI00131D8B0B|nr:FG-GAP-like repeat-containing protein [Paraglaciecola sp. L3A3]